MNQVLEYISNHPVLVGTTAAVALAVLAYEVSRARSGGQSVGPMDAVRLLNQGAVLVDVRSQAEFESGHILDARHVPQDQLASSAEALSGGRKSTDLYAGRRAHQPGARRRKPDCPGFPDRFRTPGDYRAQ